MAFNRPDPTRRVIDAIRPSRPSRVFVAGDGPRAGQRDDKALVDEVRDVVAGIDWACTVRTRYADENLGLERTIIGGITWFLDEVEAGVILEDDCVPAPAFLPMAGELLDRYADVPEVMQVSGLNMARGRRFTEHSYLFAEVGHIWGWATWRRAWSLFDEELSTWAESRDEYLAGASQLGRTLGRKFDAFHAGRKRGWPRAWYWAMLSHGGLSTIPSANLIENIGGGADATHGPTPRHPLRHATREGLAFPLDHPDALAPDPGYARLLTRYHRGSYRRQLEDLTWSVRRAIS